MFLKCNKYRIYFLLSLDKKKNMNIKEKKHYEIYNYTYILKKFAKKIFRGGEWLFNFLKFSKIDFLKIQKF